MRTPSFLITLAPDAETPLHQRISQALVQAIEAGRLRPHQALPSAQALADQLGTSRNTVLRAFQDLEAEGWILGRKGSGTYVSGTPPQQAPQAWKEGAATPQDLPSGAGFDLPSQLTPFTPLAPMAFHLDRAAQPDARLAPSEDLAKAMARGMRLHGPKLMAAAPAEGHPLLREQVALWLATHRGLVVKPEGIFITRGTRMGLDLLLRVIFPKAQRCVVESPGNPALIHLLRKAHAIEVLSLPVDAEGAQVERLPDLLAQGPIGFVLLTPHAQQPTGASLSAARRAQLLELAETHRFAIVEEDSDGEYHYEGPRPMPLAASGAGQQVIHMGSLSRLLAPGLRLGFLVAPEPVLTRLISHQKRLGSHGDAVLEWAVGDLMRDGILTRHLLRSKRVYHDRLALMAERLHQSCEGLLTFHGPKAGLSLWLEPSPGFDLEAWIGRAQRQGIWMEPPSRYFVQEIQRPGTRIGFSGLDETEIEAVFLRLQRAWLSQ